MRRMRRNLLRSTMKVKVKVGSRCWKQMSSMEVGMRSKTRIWKKTHRTRLLSRRGQRRLTSRMMPKLWRRNQRRRQRRRNLMRTRTWRNHKKTQRNKSNLKRVQRAIQQATKGNHKHASHRNQSAKSNWRTDGHRSAHDQMPCRDKIVLTNYGKLKQQRSCTPCHDHA